MNCANSLGSRHQRESTYLDSLRERTTPLALTCPWRAVLSPATIYSYPDRSIAGHFDLPKGIRVGRYENLIQGARNADLSNRCDPILGNKR